MLYLTPSQLTLLLPSPKGEGLGNCLQHSVGIAQGVVVPEAQDSIALRFQEVRPCKLIFRWGRVLASIKLDDELLREAGEVGKVRTNGHLAAPLELRQLRPEGTPQSPLSIGGITTKLASALARASRCFVVDLHDLSTSPFRRFAAPSLSHGRGIVH
jgi:hypothetical protein